MISAGLSIREDGGHLVVTLRGNWTRLPSPSLGPPLLSAS
jgi:hypothetical protein